MSVQEPSIEDGKQILMRQVVPRRRQGNGSFERRFLNCYSLSNP